MPKIRTLFCLVDIKKRYFLISCVFSFTFTCNILTCDTTGRSDWQWCEEHLVWRAVCFAVAAGEHDQSAGNVRLLFGLRSVFQFNSIQFKDFIVYKSLHYIKWKCSFRHIMFWLTNNIKMMIVNIFGLLINTFVSINFMLGSRIYNNT